MNISNANVDANICRSRAYQLEMWEASVRKNTIVAVRLMPGIYRDRYETDAMKMDTGSGKTQVSEKGFLKANS